MASSEKTDDSNYVYEDGVCFYRDPTSGSKYKWDNDKQVWTSVAKEDGTNATVEAPVSDAANPNGTDKVGMGNYEFDGKTYLYKHPDTGVVMKWNLKKKEWFPADSAANESSDEEDTTGEKQPITMNPSEIDQSSYEWDAEKRAWIPKVDDEFLARYQLSYGVTSESNASGSGPSLATIPSNEPQPEPELQPEKGTATKRKPQAGWFDVDQAHNTKVYVSNLPTDITENEFVDTMQKCGLVMKDLDNKQYKIKLYKDQEGNLKGDALCHYIKVESVELALTILDGYEVRGKQIRVERAHFSIKGEYDPSKKPRKKSKKALEKMKKKQELLFAWRPDKLRGERGKHERVVVIRHVFDPEDIDKNPALLLERQNYMRQECAKYGDVKKLIVHDRSPEGIVQVWYKEPEDADRCIQFITGRVIDGRKIKAEQWDGVTNYKSEETEQEREERLAKWSKFLEEDSKVQDEEEN